MVQCCALQGSLNRKLCASIMKSGVMSEEKRVWKISGLNMEKPTTIGDTIVTCTLPCSVSSSPFWSVGPVALEL